MHDENGFLSPWITHLDQFSSAMAPVKLKADHLSDVLVSSFCLCIIWHKRSRGRGIMLGESQAVMKTAGNVKCLAWLFIYLWLLALGMWIKKL